MKGKVIRYKEDINQRQILIEYGEKIGEERVYMGKSEDPEDKVVKYYAEESFPENNLAATIEIYTKEDFETAKIYKNEERYTCSNLPANQIFQTLKEAEAFFIPAGITEDEPGEGVNELDIDMDIYIIYYESL